jgi:hypothetical protein
MRVSGARRVTAILAFRISLILIAAAMQGSGIILLGH